jgi:hypothetical protein
VLVPLGLVAIQVVTARDAHRFVAGIVAAAGIWFVILYPNIAALPLPNSLVNAYQGLLPTYLYPFQFAVSTVSRGSTSFSDVRFGVLVLALVLAACVTAFAVRSGRRPPLTDAPMPGVLVPGVAVADVDVPGAGMEDGTRPAAGDGPLGEA